MKVTLGSSIVTFVSKNALLSIHTFLFLSALLNAALISNYDILYTSDLLNASTSSNIFRHEMNEVSLWQVLFVSSCALQIIGHNGSFTILSSISYICIRFSLVSKPVVS